MLPGHEILCRQRKWLATYPYYIIAHHGHIFMLQDMAVLQTLYEQGHLVSLYRFKKDLHWQGFLPPFKVMTIFPDQINL